MDADAMTRHINDGFDEIRAVEHSGDTFFLYDPDDVLSGERWLPFVTVVSDDTYDTVSDLSRPGSYRVNIGLTKETYTSRFGAAPTDRDQDGVLETGFDYSVRDRVMPHPHYASQYWVCVVDPADETMADVRGLLDEAYRFAVRKYANQRARRAG